MSSPASDAEPPQGLAASDPPRAEPTARNENDAGPPQPQLGLGRARWLAAIGGLLAGLAAFGIGERIYEIIPAEKREQRMFGNVVITSTPATQMVADTKNAALTFSVLGVCLGGFLGIAGGLARRRRSTSAAVTGGLLGAGLGAVLGAGLSLSLLPWFLKARLTHPDSDVVVSMAMHGLIWGMLGAAAGLAFAVGLGDRRSSGRILAAGLVGAALGAVAFELVGAVVFPMAKTGEPISETWPTRLLARLLVAAGTAAIVALLLTEPKDEAVAVGSSTQ